jgi:hypothetical protein
MSEKEKQLKIGLSYEVEVRDKNGKLISKQHGKSHSWLKQWIQILKGEFATRHGTTVGNANVSINDETGSGRTYPPQSSGSLTADYLQLSTLGDAGDVTQGIIVGGGDTPNTLTTYALASKIGHGTASGQLVYNAESVEDVINPSGMDLTFRITRTFTNNSGASVTVKEMGILVKKFDAGAFSRSFLIARDVLPSPSSVPDGATLTIRYTVKITVS